MAQPYDVTTKRLFEHDPRAWLALASLPTESPISPVDPVLPAVSPIADKVVRVDDPVAPH